MQTNGKKFLCAILSIILLIGLCACKKGSDNPGGSNPGDYEGALPEVIFDRWYPHPEVSEDSIEISADGTCNIGELTSTWEVESITEDKVVLIAGSHYLTFTQLSSSLPILTETSCGDAVKEPGIWNYITEWHNEQTGISFALALEELAQIEGNIQLTQTQLTIEAMDGETVTHTVTFTPSRAVVVDAEGNSTTYYPMNGGFGESEESDIPEAQYVQAVNDLQNVLAGGDMTDYVDSNGAIHVISGAEAIEKLYKIFLSLQNTVDVSEQLRYIRKVDNVLVCKYNSANGLDRLPLKTEYDAYGKRQGLGLAEALNTNTYFHKGYDNWFVLCGVVGGKPVYDANGRVTALEQTSSRDGATYTAPITYDAQGKVVRVDIPFSNCYEDEKETDFNEYYTFLYDAGGRLIQYSRTRESRDSAYTDHEFYEEFGFYDRVVTECYYDSNNRLNQTWEHSVFQANDGATLWWYAVTDYTYDSTGKLLKSDMSSRSIRMSLPGVISTPREEIMRMQGIQKWVLDDSKFVDSLKNDFLGQIEGHSTSDGSYWISEYEYGSIYVYQPEE